MVSTEAQLAHSRRKLNNAVKSKETLSKSETQLQTKLTSLQEELVSVKKAAERAQGATYPTCDFHAQIHPFWYSRGTPTDFRTQCGVGRGKSGRISSTVSVIFIALWSYVHVLYHSKASSSVLAVDERQSLETLTREEKTASRTLAQLSEKEQGFDEKKTTRTEELQQRNAKREEVGLPVSCLQKKKPY